MHVISVNNGKRVRLLLYAEDDALIAWSHNKWTSNCKKLLAKRESDKTIIKHQSTLWHETYCKYKCAFTLISESKCKYKWLSVFSDRCKVVVCIYVKYCEFTKVSCCMRLLSAVCICENFWCTFLSSQRPLFLDDKGNVQFLHCYAFTFVSSYLAIHVCLQN